MLRAKHFPLPLLSLAFLNPAFLSPAQAQLTAPAAKPAAGARMPALSPDGKQLAFVYRGDVWVSPGGGGRAYPVTQHAELDAYPLFSPDGQWIAFSSVRNGNWDIYLVPTTGGEARQLTFSSGGEIATDWSPDGKTLLFTNNRDTPDSTLFSLDVVSLRFKALTRDYKPVGQAAFSPDGQSIVFQRHGFPWTRPRYAGSSAAQIWTLGTGDSKRTELTSNEFQHLWPRFLPGGKEIVAVSVGELTPSAPSIGKPTPKIAGLDNNDRTPNLWVFPADKAGKPRRLTNFVGGSGVRFPAVARQSGDIVFEAENDLYLMKAGAKEPEKLVLFCGGEDKGNNVSRETLTGGVEEALISPDGKTFAFGVKGDIWSIPLDKPKNRNADVAARLTDYAGFDRDFTWSADAKTVYFVSDRANNDRIYALDAATKAVKPIWEGNADARNPQVSPDGKWLGFWVAGPSDEQGNGTGGLYIKPIPGPPPAPTPKPDEKKEGEKKGEEKKEEAPKDGEKKEGEKKDEAKPSEPAKDEKPAEVKAPVAPPFIDGPARKVLPLTGSVQGDFSWSPDMKWIAFTRQGAETGGTNVWIMPADGSGKPVNVTRLNAFHRMPRWSPDGKYLFFASNRNGNGLYVLPLKPEDARADELEIKFEKPKDPVKVEIDFQDTAQRVRLLTTQYPSGDLIVTEGGLIYFLSEGDVWSCSYDGKETKKLSNLGGVSNLAASKDGRTVYFMSGGNLYSMKVRVADNLAVGADGPAPVTFSADYTRDLRDERHAAFTQFWRSYNTRFYDGGFHGRDWAALRTRYEPMLDAVATRDEFSTLLNRMVGELEASHSEVGPAPSPIKSPQTRFLGVTYDYSYVGPGLKVATVPPRAPGSYAKTSIKPGEYILAIDGQDVTLDENLFKVLNDKGDRDFELLVNSKPSKEGARTVKFKALTWGDWTDIFYRNRTERLRQIVENGSENKLAYVHIAGMGGNNQTTFERELYEYAEGKQGVIIDVRFNGGGNISDTLINWLGIKPYGKYVPRDGYIEPGPGRSWDKPIVVLMNENSASNAEMFPFGMRASGLAKLVGMPTPGYVIWTTGLPLVDGTSARMPMSGVYRKDGSNMEDNGEQPDVRVPMSNEDWQNDRDPQLYKAIDILLKDLAAKGK